MKSLRICWYMLMSLLVTALTAEWAPAAPLGTAITYQGQLKQSGVPYNGTADAMFTLYDAAAGGLVIAGPVSVTNISVVNGLFTISVDFGAGRFGGDARYLGVQVRTPTGAGSYVTLSPRQAITATAYAQGLRLPVSQAVNTGLPAMKIQNTGTGQGIQGDANSGVGVYGTANTGTAVYGYSEGGVGVEALSLNGAYGIYAQALNGVGVHADHPSGASGSLASLDAGVKAIGSQAVPGIVAQGFGGETVSIATGDIGVLANNPNGPVVYATASGVNAGALGTSVYGLATGPSGTGVRGEANAANGRGVWGSSTSGWAGYFNGKVEITGPLIKPAGSFRIDHPLDPAHKYLQHSFVESPDMMNIYNGNITTDGRGYAEVVLPEWFEALNKDFRYQLTVIDAADSEQFVQAKVVRPVQNNRFAIRTSRPHTQVSWQVTGVRKDAYAEAHRIQVEVAKPVEGQEGD